MTGIVIHPRGVHDGKRLGNTLPKEANHSRPAVFAVFDFDLDELICLQSLAGGWKFNVAIGIVNFILKLVNEQLTPDP